MDMTEKVIVGPSNPSDDPSRSFPQQRKINFKCVDSLFFSEFDGDWTVSELAGDNGGSITKLHYLVDVRPKGPVPVAALEWRIREDVPTNLRAVKRAAVNVGEVGVMTTRRQPLRESVQRSVQFIKEPVRFRMDWGEDETMAAYLKKE
jgi:hypothetical protein